MFENIQVNSDHRIRNLLDRSMSAARRLEDIYNDEDQLRKEEINKIAGPNEFTEFYTRLRFQITGVSITYSL